MAIRNAICVILSIQAGMLMGSAATAAPGHDIIIVAGNSNAAGEGRGAYKYSAADHPRILQINASLKAVRARRDRLDHPGYRPPALVGPALNMARAYRLSAPKDRKIVLVPVAVPGSVTSCFLPDSPCHRELVRRTGAAMSLPGDNRDVGAIWSATENEAVLGVPVDQWRAQMATILADLRSRYGAFPVLMVEPPRGWKHQRKAAYMRALKQQSFGMVSVVSTAGLKGNPGDPIHFDARSQMVIGERAAAALREVQTMCLLN